MKGLLFMEKNVPNDRKVNVILDLIAALDGRILTIINRSEGVVDKQVFKFADIIGQYQRPGRESLDPHMWEYNNKPEWYTPITQSQKATIADTVLGYIEMYQDQTMVGPTM